MRFLTEEELKVAIVGCVGSPTTPEGSIGGSLTIRLCGDGGDTDHEPAEDAIFFG
jgi:hypothetical protein